MSINDIKQAISRGNFTTTELQGIINYSRTVMETQTKATISEGDKVFVVQKTKRTPGIVTQVKRTRCVVDMQGGSYNVPLSMIEVA